LIKSHKKHFADFLSLLEEYHEHLALTTTFWQQHVLLVLALNFSKVTTAQLFRKLLNCPTTRNTEKWVCHLICNPWRKNMTLGFCKLHASKRFFMLKISFFNKTVALSLCLWRTSKNFNSAVKSGLASSGVASPKIWRGEFGGAKMFDFRRITLFCLEKRLSKHKITMFPKNLGGPWPLWPPPGYA